MFAIETLQPLPRHPRSSRFASGSILFARRSRCFPLEFARSRPCHATPIHHRPSLLHTHTKLRLTGLEPLVWNRRWMVRAANSSDADDNPTAGPDGKPNQGGGSGGGTDETASASQAGTGPSSSSGSRPSGPRREKKWKGGWWKRGKWQWQPIIQAQEIGALLVQLGIVMFAMRLLRPGIALPGSEPRVATSFVSVPFSEFLSKISSDQVQKVEVDGVHIMFRLRAESGSSVGDAETASGVVRSQEAEVLMKSVAPTKRVIYTTTRPTDIKTPYEKMLENQVEFGSPDKRSGEFFNSALVN